MSFYKGTVKAIDLPDATNVELKLPKGSKEHLIQIVPNAPFFVAFSEDDMDNGRRLELVSGDRYVIDAPVQTGVSLWLRQESGGAVEARWGYLYPTIR